jgi:hypothetical protein
MYALLHSSRFKTRALVKLTLVQIFQQQFQDYPRPGCNLGTLAFIARLTFCYISLGWHFQSVEDWLFRSRPRIPYSQLG